MRAPIVVDFETRAIGPRPAEYPPEPVGAAILYPGRRGKYLAWAHATDNNTTKMKAWEELVAIWRSGARILFHNFAFDVEVGYHHLDLPLPSADLIECSQIGAFLYDPNALRIDLKELAQDLCAIAPTARDGLREWILANVPEATSKTWGAHIWRAPGRLAGQYAIADVEMTQAIFAPITARIAEHAMTDRYRRKIRAAFLLIEMGRRGVPTDVRKMKREVARAEKVLTTTDRWLAKHLRVPDLNVDSKDDLADAIERRGFIDEWILTGKSEKRSVAIDALAEVLKDRPTYEVLAFRSKLTNGIRTFGKPWLEMAETSGRIFTIWNQTKQTREGRGTIGARTGRLSSTPNFQNVPVKPDVATADPKVYAELKTEGDNPFLLPADLVAAFNGTYQLLNPRGWVVGERGHVVAVRDYSQQELRILAHYVGGALLLAYADDPDLDFHEHARGLINQTLGTAYRKKPIKNLGFGIIYGQSIPLTAEILGETYGTAKKLRQTYKRIFPGLEDLERELKTRGAKNEPIVTWGGRVYWCEPPRYSDKFGRVMSFEYKLLNTLIQGSAADCTEEAMLNYDELKVDGDLTLQVHDELVGSFPRGAAKTEMNLLREAMEAVKFDVPMLSAGKIGPSWADGREFVDRRTT